jgi:iron(III) transport system permease protein
MVCLVMTTITLPGCPQERGLACLQDATLRSYRYVLFDLAETRIAFTSSGLYGSLSALLIMGLSIVVLAVMTRHRRLLAATETLFAILMSTPGAIIALGLIVSASGRFGINLYNTPWIVVVAMILKHQSLAFQPLRTGLANISGSLLEAGRLSGASATTVWRKIVLPMIKPDVTGAFFLALIPILGELTMSIFLASPSYRSIGTVLFDLQDYADHASAGALSVVLMFVILTANEAARRLSGGRVGY